MKTMVAAVIFIAAGTMNTCGTAKFDLPQPDGVKSLASFPQRIHGNYLAPDEASTVTISDYMVTRYFNFDFKIHKDSLDGPPYKTVGDTLIYLDGGNEVKIVVKGDTAICRIDGIDTLFSISKNNILKKYKGYYFLNNRDDEQPYWEVKKVSLRNGVLTIGSASSEEDIRKLKEITEATADTIPKYFTLTRRQFKSFIRHKGFSEKEVYNKMAGKQQVR